MSTPDPIADRTVLITGANRGLGSALLDEVLSRGARRVYAGMRHQVRHPDERVTWLPLDITDAAEIEAAGKSVTELDLLINNAGVASYAELEDRAELERMLAVNLFGPYDLCRAFQHHLIASGGAVVNVLSIAALAAVPVMPAYSISKAATHSLTQSLRALLALRGVRVHAAYVGPMDTDMTKGLHIPKTAPDVVAGAILDGLAAGTEDLFPDPLAAMLTEGWSTGTIKTMERGNAALLTS
jgi:NAD(P)-dependent dehydrogenase (short-subunit alcohol dehydrogenase family)